jgi:hypothetical protein
MDLLASMAETEQKASTDGATKAPDPATVETAASVLGKRERTPSVSGADVLQRRDAAGGGGAAGSPAALKQSAKKIREAEASAIETLSGGLRQPSASKSAKKAAVDLADSRS